MRLTVFGATGGVGQGIVRQAQEAGHGVTAVVRDPARLPDGLRGAPLHAVVPLGDAAAVRAAVAGRDAVLPGLGAGAGRPVTSPSGSPGGCWRRWRRRGSGGGWS